MKESKTILVTGGAGFVGSALCKRLRDEGHDVYSLDNYFTGSEDNHHEGVTYLDLSTQYIESHVDFKPDVIYHLGEYSRVEQSFADIDKVIEFNKLGTMKVLNFALKNKCKLIYAGSSTKFGDGGDNADASPYAWSKSSNVQMIKNYGEWFGLDYAIVYFYNVYGPGELQTGPYATLIGLFTEKFKNNEQLKVVLPGVQQRNFTHIDDTVDALLLVLDNGSGDGYGIGSPEAYSVEDVAKMFTDNIIYLPARPGNRMTADVICTKTRELGWEPKKNLKDYIDGIKEVLERDNNV